MSLSETELNYSKSKFWSRLIFDDTLIDETHDNKEQQPIYDTKEEMQGATNKDVELQQESDAEYVNDEPDREDSNIDLTDRDGDINEEQVKFVSNKKYEVSSSSKTLQLNSHFFMILCFSMFVRNIVK